MGGTKKEIKWLREKWVEEIENDLKHVSHYHLEQYKKGVENGNLYCFGFYEDEIRIGTALAEIVRKDGYKNMIALEVGGKGLSVTEFYFPFFIALSKFHKCKNFIIGTSRKAIEKYCIEKGFKKVYTEYSIEVDNVK